MAAVDYVSWFGVGWCKGLEARKKDVRSCNLRGRRNSRRGEEVLAICGGRRATEALAIIF
jgi:hypothetical protein